MVPEQPLEATEHGLVAGSDGWFVLNAAEARWRERPGRGAYCDLEGDSDFSQVGINIQTLAPGEPMAMYHWEADQEDFLVLAGEGVLVIEGQERPLRRWDFVHCPAGTEHVIVAAGSGPLVVLCIGAAESRLGRTGVPTRSTPRPGGTTPASTRRPPTSGSHTPASRSRAIRATGRVCCLNDGPCARFAGCRLGHSQARGVTA